MSTETLTNVAHTDDVTYQINRQRQIDELLKLSPQQLDRRLNWLMNSETHIRDDHHISQKMIGEMLNAPYTPSKLKAGILDSTGGTTGNVLIRQDLEPTLYTLFVKVFPAFERLAKGPANGLVHAANQITSPDTSALGSTIIASDLGTVSYVASNFVRQTYPIAIFATGRGVSLKELAAVQAGGAPYDPQRTELTNGMYKIATDVQWAIMQGNATNAAGTNTNEGGTYNTNAFDGFRSVIGSYGGYSTNNAIQIDMSSLNMLESMQLGAAKAANNGGKPTLAFTSMNAKQALDSEQQNNQRYNNDMVEIIPGVRCNQIAWANGLITVVPVPGSSIGTYLRTSDSANVEDVYLLDESAIFLRWLYSESFTVLQIPSGVDAQLSNRFIIFGMFGLEQAAPLFCAKVRRLAS